MLAVIQPCRPPLMLSLGHYYNAALWIDNLSKIIFLICRLSGDKTKDDFVQMKSLEDVASSEASAQIPLATN